MKIEKSIIAVNRRTPGATRARVAKSNDVRQARQRLECACFSTAFRKFAKISEFRVKVSSHPQATTGYHSLPKPPPPGETFLGDGKRPEAQPPRRSKLSQ